MSSLQFRQRFVAAKKEETYGVDSSPTAAANAILLSDVSITPMGADKVSRDLVGRGLGADPSVLANLMVDLQCSVELAGSGTAGTPPAWGPLLMACGFAQTINAGTDVQYDPVSGDFDSLTIYFNFDGNLHKMLGTRGNVAFNLSKGGIPKMEFSFKGLFVDPEAATFPAGDFSAFQPPLIVNKANTPSFTLDGYAAAMESLSIDMGNQVVFTDRVNVNSVKINDRSATGNVEFEAEDIGTKNWFNLARNSTQVLLQMVHGTQAGNIIQIDAPKVEIDAPNYSDSDGQAMHPIGLTLIPNAGDDEIKITVK